MRKEAGFEVMDKIRVWIDTDNEELKNAVKSFEDKIRQIVLAGEFTLGACDSADAFKANKDINDIKTDIAVERI